MAVYLAAADVNEPDPDREPLSRALQAAGIDFAWPHWDDPRVDWSAARVCYPRATWDYYLDVGSFLRWAETVASQSELRNPLSVVRWNVDKRYMLELETAGVPCVPTRLVEKGADVGLDQVRSEMGWDHVVAKPSVSCGSWHTYAVAGDASACPWDELVSQRAMLVQPYVASVDDVGERSIVLIDGEMTHVIRKAPRFAGGVESVTGPFEPNDAERSLVEAALSHVEADLDYARVDVVVDDDGSPMIAELELLEPSLFFAHSAPALERFIRMVERRL